MEDEDEEECSILGNNIFPESFSMFMDISDTHYKYDSIHEKCPKPERARMYPHTIKGNRKTIETEGDKEHSSARISIERLNRIRKSYMRLLNSEIIGSRECEEYPEKAIDIDPFTEEEDTR